MSIQSDRDQIYFVFVCFFLEIDVSSLVRTATTRTYTIVAPKVLRPSSDYHVSLSLHGSAGVTSIEVAIEGRQDGGGPVRNAQRATIEPNSTQIIKFQVVPKKK